MWLARQGPVESHLYIWFGLQSIANTILDPWWPCPNGVNIGAVFSFLIHWLAFQVRNVLWMMTSKGKHCLLKHSYHRTVLCQDASVGMNELLRMTLVGRYSQRVYRVWDQGIAISNGNDNSQQTSTMSSTLRHQLQVRCWSVRDVQPVSHFEVEKQWPVRLPTWREIVSIPYIRPTHWTHSTDSVQLCCNGEEKHHGYPEPWEIWGTVPGCTDATPSCVFGVYQYFQIWSVCYWVLSQLM